MSTGTPVATQSSQASSAPGSTQPRWVPVDLPGQYSEMRTVIFDRGRDCIWVMSRGSGSSSTGPDVMSLTRVNVADRSIVNALSVPVVDYDTGSIAIDSQDILWMGWGETLMRFDPATGATKSWTRPAYSGLARLYSGDGRMVAMTIDSSGEIWLAAGMVSGLFGFNPKTSTWDRPINLPFVPAGWGTGLAAPSAGVLTINGATLDAQSSPRFAVITTATHAVKVLPLPIQQYVSVGGGEIVSWDKAGNLALVRLQDGSSTVIGTAQGDWIAGRAAMSLDLQGNVWFPVATSRGFTGVEKLNPTTHATSEFLFPIVVSYRMPAPSPSSCFMPHTCFPRPCPAALVYRCIPTQRSDDPGIQGMAADTHGDVWAVTEAGSSSGLDGRYPPMGPLVELEPAA